MWTPDVYQGAPAPVSGFIGRGGPRAAALVVHSARARRRLPPPAAPLGREAWRCCGRLASGRNLAALAQRDFKRMLAYSSISHAGFLLFAVAAANQTAAARSSTTDPLRSASLGAFAIAAAASRTGEPTTLDNLAGYGWERRCTESRSGSSCSPSGRLPANGGFVGKSTSSRLPGAAD